MEGHRHSRRLQGRRGGDERPEQREHERHSDEPLVDDQEQQRHQDGDEGTRPRKTSLNFIMNGGGSGAAEPPADSDGTPPRPARASPRIAARLDWIQQHSAGDAGTGPTSASVAATTRRGPANTQRTSRRTTPPAAAFSPSPPAAAAKPHGRKARRQQR